MNLCYATIQRKILPQLAGLMTLEKQGLLTSGQLTIHLDFDWAVIQEAVQELANKQGWEYHSQALYVGPVKVYFDSNYYP